jgi:hypothetical protein
MTTVIHLQVLRTRTFRSAGVINEPPVVIDEPKAEPAWEIAKRRWFKPTPDEAKDDDDEYNQRAHARMQQELAELENSRARYQAQFGQVVARAA